MYDLGLNRNYIKNNISFGSNNTVQSNPSVENKSKYWLNQTSTEPQTISNITSQPKIEVKNQHWASNIDGDDATNAAGTAVLLRGVQWCIEKLSELCSRILMRGKEFAPADEVMKVADAMKKNNGLTADIHYIDNANKGALKRMFPGLGKELDTVANGGNAFYTSQGGFAVAPKSKPSLMLHELGHATNFEKSKFFKGLQKLKVLGMYAPMALAFLNDISGKRNDGKESFIERNAGIIGFSAFLPTIIEEAAASLRGIQAAKKTLPKVKLGALKKNYFFAWLTYVLAGVGIGLASKLAITERNFEKISQRKQSKFSN